MEKKKIEKGKIDWLITIAPLVLVVALCVLFIVFPDGSNNVISKVKWFFGDKLGVYYLVIGLGFLGVALFLAFSKFGKIRLGGQDEKPKYSFFAWGSMMFTCGLAADILFYSFSEWAMYGDTPLGSFSEYGETYSLFHWSFIPWAFYLVLAVAFGFMLHVRKRNKQKYSEACRPVLGKHTDGWAGRIIDLLAVFALLAGTATTFSVATPLIAIIIQKLFKITLSRTIITIIILLLTCAVYTFSLLKGFKGISILAKACIYMFFGLLILVLIIGGKAGFIIENGFESIGKMFQNFITMATHVDPSRTSTFAQDWTIYFWAYWMVWCVAAPFFIGNISKGRTIKEVILGGFAFGVGSTLVSFIVLEGYGIGVQNSGVVDLIGQYNANGDLYELIVSIIDTLPAAPFFLVVILLTMIAFYATSFDSIAYTASCYSYKKLDEGEQPHKLIQLLWCILLIVLPIGLVFSESSMANIQSVSIISAFPIGIVMILMVVSFFKDSKKYMGELGWISRDEAKPKEKKE